MRAIECWPIQYLIALGIASQSPGYFPNAEYMPAQMTRKRMPAETRGERRARLQRQPASSDARGDGPAGSPAPRTRHQRP